MSGSRQRRQADRRRRSVPTRRRCSGHRPSGPHGAAQQGSARLRRERCRSHSSRRLRTNHRRRHVKLDAAGVRRRPPPIRIAWPTSAPAPKATESRMTTLLADVVEARARRRRPAAGSPSATRSPPACARAAADEVEIAVAYLSGETRQGRIGIGYATLAALRGAPAPQPGADAARGRRRARPHRGDHRQGLGGRAQRAAARAVRARHRRRAGLPACACSSASCARARSKA